MRNSGANSNGVPTCSEVDCRSSAGVVLAYEGRIALAVIVVSAGVGGRPVAQLPVVVLAPALEGCVVEDHAGVACAEGE